eukprot:m.348182 g.348182  ORF g.348182 m.348182 type:complete len:95 (-) comp55865_c0_seq7:85-369(-)
MSSPHSVHTSSEYFSLSLRLSVCASLPLNPPFVCAASCSSILPPCMTFRLKVANTYVLLPTLVQPAHSLSRSLLVSLTPCLARSNTQSPLTHFS